ncbi:hypothetical protein V6C32_10875 [Desulforamulus ruminis]|uniref:hypothetical protein n=1 Tax=Desulforamulus ruminis TaxID=1564 RepID=UPI002FDAD695
MDLNVLRKEMTDLAEELSIESIADLYKLTPEEVQIILDGGEIEIEETVRNEQPVMVFKATTRVEKQKVLSVWRTGGRVGATTVATLLAKMISEKMKTLYICCNFSDGGSDAIPYLYLPYFPREKFSVDPVLPVPGHENLFAIPPVTYLKTPIPPENVQAVILEARERFDCIVLDLPNSQDETTLTAAQCATHMIWVVGSDGQEVQRVASRSARFSDKEQLFIANRVSRRGLLKTIPVDIDRMMEATHDTGMKDPGSLSFKSSLYQAVAQIYTAIFIEKPDGPSLLDSNKIGIRKRLEKIHFRLGRGAGALFNSFKKAWYWMEGPIYAVCLLVFIIASLVTLITYAHHNQIEHPWIERAYNLILRVLEWFQ